MLAAQNPASFVTRTEMRKAAFNNGFRIERGEVDGWAAYASTTAQGQVFLAGADNSGPWYLALDHPGVVAELGVPQRGFSGPGLARYAFSILAELYSTLAEVYRLGDSLPDAPLQQFETAVTGLSGTTEAERLVIQRVGQDIFRRSLLRYWRDRCPLTGISEPALLRASHIVPWALCESDAQRLDVHNGLLLSALWDAAFDTGLVSFREDGSALFSPSLGEKARLALWAEASAQLVGLTSNHFENLAWHRARHGFA